VLDPAAGIDFSIISGATAEVIGADGVYGIAALEPQYFFACASAFERRGAVLPTPSEPPPAIARAATVILSL